MPVPPPTSLPAYVHGRYPGDLPFDKYTSVSEITHAVFPRDDSALLFSEVRKTLGVDLETVADELASRMITTAFRQKP